MVSLPPMMARVGDRMRSLVKPTALAPKDSMRSWRSDRARYFSSRSVIRSPLSQTVLDDVHEIGDRSRLGEDIERNVDIEVVLDFHDEVHHRDGIDIEIGRDIGVGFQSDLGRVERLEQLTQG